MDYFKDGENRKINVERGYWMAERPCTLGLWLIALERIPGAGWTGELDQTIENVGWKELTEQFLPTLQMGVPSNIRVALPSEIQWEYAFWAGQRRLASQVLGSSGIRKKLTWTIPMSGWQVSMATFQKANAWGVVYANDEFGEWCLPVLEGGGNWAAAEIIAIKARELFRHCGLDAEDFQQMDKMPVRVSYDLDEPVENYWGVGFRPVLEII